jgi:hypothetical protein
VSWGRRFLFVFVALLASTAVLPAATAAPRTGADVVESCRARIGSAPQVGERACRTTEQFANGFGNGCRNAGGADTCAAFDGRKISAAHMAAYRKGWTHRALALQRGLDDNVPFSRATIPHTHNTFNASVYNPTLTNQDPNQVYSITDQLEMDIRAVEMDVHWVPSPFGKPRNKMRAVVLCHGDVHQGVHVGCTNDRWFPAGLKELRSWLLRSENAREVVLIYLENNLDGNRTAHNEAAAEIQRGLGDLAARPPAGKPCAPLPTSTTPAGLRAAGHRVVIVGNCGPGQWGTWVHERGNNTNWIESSSGPGEDYPGLKGCAVERARTHAGQAIVRWFEDSTWLTAMTRGTSGHLTKTEATAMAQCGVTLIGFDQLVPEDPRLPAIVWSWAPGLPAAPKGIAACAASAGDTHFHDEPCGNVHAFACSVSPDVWKITATTAHWGAGADVCSQQFPGSVFAVPANGWENGLVRAAAGSATVWVNYADAVGDGAWKADASRR